NLSWIGHLLKMHMKMINTACCRMEQIIYDKLEVLTVNGIGSHFTKILLIVFGINIFSPELPPLMVLLESVIMQKTPPRSEVFRLVSFMLVDLVGAYQMNHLLINCHGWKN